MQYVGVGPRFVATIVDTVVLVVVGWVMALLFGQAGATGFSLTGGPFLLYVFVSFGYFIVLEATRGATLGKRLLGQRVVKVDGSPLDWRASVLRNVLRIVDGLPFAYLVGAILVLTSDRKQRLGDRVADTVVVSAASLEPGLPVARREERSAP